MLSCEFFGWSTFASGIQERVDVSRGSPEYILKLWSESAPWKERVEHPEVDPFPNRSNRGQFFLVDIKEEYDP